jgi:hypothetical protein
MNPKHWTDLISAQENIICDLVERMNTNPSNSNSLRKQYVNELDVLVKIIDAFHTISRPYLLAIQAKVKGEIRD